MVGVVSKPCELFARRFLFRQASEPAFVHNLHRSAGQLHHALALEIPEHARYNFPGIAHVVADELVGNPERMGAFDGCFLQQESGADSSMTCL